MKDYRNDELLRNGLGREALNHPPRINGGIRKELPPDKIKKVSTEQLPIILFSDSSGETAAHIVKAATSQFENLETKVQRTKPIRSKKDIDLILSETEDVPIIAAYTIVIPELKQHLEDRLAERINLVGVDLLSPLVSAISHCVQQEPSLQPRRRHVTDRAYYQRMEAINFSVRFDDGKCLHTLHEADIILIGVSRTSKTPTCMYLANNYGLRSANVPIVSGTPIPEALFKISKQKIVGLTIDSDQLIRLRINRARCMGIATSTAYSDFNAITAELRETQRIFQKLKCRVINVTNKAIEETASEIVRLFD